MNLEASIADRFIERLKSLDPGERERLRGVGSQLLRTPWSSRSAFEMAENDRRRIEEAIEQDPRGVAVIIQFVTGPELIGGIELITNGHKSLLDDTKLFVLVYSSDNQ